MKRHLPWLLTLGLLAVLALNMSAAAQTYAGNESMPRTTRPGVDRFPVAHVHTGSYCLGYLYVTPDRIVYEVARPLYIGDYGFEILRSEVIAVRPWETTGSRSNATEIKTAKGIYHLWLLPREDDLDARRPPQFNPSQSAPAAKLISALESPATPQSATPAEVQEYGPGGARSDAELPIPGRPPLTKELVDKSSDFFEWLLDAHLTQQQRAIYQDSLAMSWKQHRQEDIDGTIALIQYKEELMRKTPAEQRLGRDALCERMLAKAQETPNAGMIPWILNVYYAAHRPIANGKPPLTAEVADAYAEFVSFMMHESLGRLIFRADRRFKNMIAQSLAAQYPMYSPQQQMQFAEMPALWEALRMRWPQLTEMERAKYRNMWRPSVMALLSPQNPGYGGNSQGNASDSSLQDFMAKNSEHQFVNSMANSSFATTMSLHLNMWH